MQETPPSDVPASATPTDAVASGDVTTNVHDDATEGGDSALKSRKPASRVWQFFSPRYHSAKDQRVCVKCKMCDLELTYANTTNLHNHLVRKHGSDYLKDLASRKKVCLLLPCLDNFIYTNYELCLQVKVTEALFDKKGADGQVDIHNTTLNPYSTARKRELDELFTKWVVKSTRPTNIGNDLGLRQWISCLSGGRYKPPVPATVQKYTLELAAECKVSLRGDLKRLADDKVMPSLSADIWGENGKSLFGVLLYYIDRDFVMHEKVRALHVNISC